MHAGDISLLTASVLQMHRLLEICFKFGLCYDLIFNFTKFVWAYVGKLQNNCKIELKVENNVIPQCNSIAYLGIDFKFTSSLSVVDYVKRKQKFFPGAVCSSCV